MSRGVTAKTLAAHEIAGCNAHARVDAESARLSRWRSRFAPGWWWRRDDMSIAVEVGEEAGRDTLLGDATLRAWALGFALRFADDATSFQQGADTTKNRGDERLEVGGGGRARWMKDQRLAVLSRRVDAVKNKKVEMQVTIERASKALHERHGARLSVFRSSHRGLVSVPSKEDVDEDAKDGREKARVSRQEKAESL